MLGFSCLTQMFKVQQNDEKKFLAASFKNLSFKTVMDLSEIRFFSVFLRMYEFSFLLVLYSTCKHSIKYYPY